MQIIEILKTTEADTKSVFGRYGSQRMKDWQAIASLYEKDSIYLGEAAQILVRNVNYEIPSVKKQITKFDQLIDEAEKKIQDQSTTETVLISQRTALCQKLGINGINLRDEFFEKVKELPKLHSEVALLIKKLDQALGLYGKASKNVECLPVLRHIIAKGNTTVYEYIHGEAPLSIEEPPAQIKLSVDTSMGNAATNDDNDAVGSIVWNLSNKILISTNFCCLFQIDFGDGEIDFGESGDDIKLESGDIDWGDDENKNDVDINAISLKECAITVESSGLAGGIAKNDNALTVLDNPSYREQFLDELFEVWFYFED